MNELPAEIEEVIAQMTPEDFAAMKARTRPPEESDPKAAAAQAVRRLRGTDGPKRPANKAAAAEAMRILRQYPSDH